MLWLMLSRSLSLNNALTHSLRLMFLPSPSTSQCSRMSTLPARSNHSSPMMTNGLERMLWMTISSWTPWGSEWAAPVCRSHTLFQSVFDSSWYLIFQLHIYLTYWEGGTSTKGPLHANVTISIEIVHLSRFSRTYSRGMLYMCISECL